MVALSLPAWRRAHNGHDRREAAASSRVHGSTGIREIHFRRIPEIKSTCPGKSEFRNFAWLNRESKISDLQYGDTFELQGLGYEGSIELPAVGGYLALDTSKYAVTTDSPVATWKFESQDGKKKGSVMVGDVVKLVNVTPKSTAGQPLQAVRESNAKAYGGKPSDDVDSWTWHIFGVEDPANPGNPNPYGVAPIPETLIFAFPVASRRRLTLTTAMRQGSSCASMGKFPRRSTAPRRCTWCSRGRR
ncbi:hypothetical protein [Bordetella sp. H567]|uniref:hypothetical protein n=1 Tax=Bordetella sp. H567 TaxID=1697043 RepID=UPI0011AB6434|nr:hypothetical protein [Bordetella sp. H567]